MAWRTEGTRRAALISQDDAQAVAASAELRMLMVSDR